MIETGSTGFMLLAASLVMLMTPALAFFYGGLATKRNILGIMIQSFASLGWTTVLWVTFGYSLCFSGGEGGLMGNLDKAFLAGIGMDSIYTGNHKIPEIVFIAYQMMFAIITPALITGAFVNRVSFKAYMIFLTVWQILVYYPFVHMVWGGGLLAEWGVLDFAGGIVFMPQQVLRHWHPFFMSGKGSTKSQFQTAFHWWLSEADYYGSDGMDLMQAANFRLMVLPHSHS
jgi:Amt family ammonium transporter